MHLLPTHVNPNPNRRLLPLQNQKALSYKHFRGGAYEDYNVGGDTSPDVTPPVQRGNGANGDDPYAKPSGGDVGATTGTLSYGAPKKAAGKKRQPNGSGKPQRKGTAAGRGSKKHIPADATDAPDLVAGTGLPEVGPPAPIKLPGAAKDCPPSDASWPSDPQMGVSVSGKKNPRWSGSRELRAYLRRTGYDKVEDEDGDPQGQRQRRPKSGKRLSGGSSRVVQAIKRTGSYLSEKSSSRRNTFDWVDDPVIGGIRRVDSADPDTWAGVSMADIGRMDVERAGRGGEKGPGRSRGRERDDVSRSNLPAVPPPPAVEAPAAKTHGRSRSREAGSGKAHRRGSGSREDKTTAAALFDKDPPARSLASLLSGGNPRRVAPAEDEEPKSDAFGDFDASFVDKKWGGGGRAAEPEPPSASRSRSRDVGRSSHAPSRRSGEMRKGREADRSRGGRGRRGSRSVEPAAERETTWATLASHASRNNEEEDHAAAEEERLRAEKARKMEALEEMRAEKKRTERDRDRARRGQDPTTDDDERAEAERERTRLREQQKSEEREQERARKEAERRERKARKQQQEEEEEGARQHQRRRRQNEDQEPEAPDPRRERGGGSGRVDDSTRRGDKTAVTAAATGRRGSGRERERGRGAGKEQDSRPTARARRSESTSNRRQEASHRDRERNRGENHDGRRREGSGRVQHRGRPADKSGDGDGDGDRADKAERAARSRSTPAGPAAAAAGGRETAADRPRRRSRDPGGREEQPPQREKKAAAGRSRDRDRDRREGGESRRRSSTSPTRAPATAAGSAKPAAATSRPAAAAAKPAAAKKSSATRFSNDPRARKERAAMLQEKRASAKAGGHE